MTERTSRQKVNSRNAEITINTREEEPKNKRRIQNEGEAKKLEEMKKTRKNRKNG